MTFPNRKNWTDEEKTTARAMIAAGDSYAAIGEVLGRSAGGIRAFKENDDATARLSCVPIGSLERAMAPKTFGRAPELITQRLVGGCRDMSAGHACGADTIGRFCEKHALGQFGAMRVEADMMGEGL